MGVGEGVATLSGALVTQGIGVSVGQIQPSGTSVGVGSANILLASSQKDRRNKNNE